MFTSSKKNSVENTSVDTLIGASTNISGNINANGIVRIDGNYTGDIATQTAVIIGEGGFVKGDITAQNVSIAGSVQGNLKCDEHLEILSKGVLYGDIEVRRISISEGGIFNGRCNMITEELVKIAESTENNEE